MSTEQMTPGSPSYGSAPTILVIDNVAANRDLAKHVIEAAGYRVLIARNVDEALVLAKETTPDLALCDLHMPGTSGREVMEWVRSNRPNVRTLLLSGDVSGKETEEFARSCGAHFLPKPFNITELRRAVQRLTS